MGQTNRDGISGIAGGRLCQSQQSPDHEGNLILGGRPLSNDGLLYPLGRVFMDREAFLRCGEYRHASGSTQNNGRCIALHEDDFFNRKRRRLVSLDRCAQGLVNGDEASLLGKRGRIFHHRVFQTTGPGSDLF